MVVQSKDYEIFLSYKNTENGARTKDAEMARDLYEALRAVGINTFFAEISLQNMGESQFQRAIDRALDTCSVLVVIATSVKNIESQWVQYEWNSFHQDILNGQKKGELFSYVDKISPHDLPRPLRSRQCFEKCNTRIESMIDYLLKALPRTNEESERCILPEKQEVLPGESREMDTIDKLLSFANQISRWDSNGEYVNPYISDEMEDIIAKAPGKFSEYNAERCNMEGLNPVIYEVFLAQKIARINEMESCANAFNLLHYVVNSWTALLNENKKIVAYWIFIALKEDHYDRIKTGEVDEKNISIDDVRYIDMPGRYKGYLLLSGTIEECRTPKVVNTLYTSWLTYLEELAKNGIFFDEISSMVGSPQGNSTLGSIGMKYYAEYKFGGKMYKYEMEHIDSISYLKDNFPLMTDLYRRKYRDNDSISGYK